MDVEVSSRMSMFGFWICRSMTDSGLTRARLRLCAPVTASSASNGTSQKHLPDPGILRMSTLLMCKSVAWRSPLRRFDPPSRETPKTRITGVPVSATAGGLSVQAHPAL